MSACTRHARSSGRRRGRFAHRTRTAFTLPRATERIGALLLALLLSIALSPTWCCCAIQDALQRIGSDTTPGTALAGPATTRACCAPRAVGNLAPGDCPACPSGNSDGCPCRLLALKAAPVGSGSAVVVPPSALTMLVDPHRGSNGAAILATPVRIANPTQWVHGPPRQLGSPVANCCRLIV